MKEIMDFLKIGDRNISDKCMENVEENIWRSAEVLLEKDGQTLAQAEVKVMSVEAFGSDLSSRIVMLRERDDVALDDASVAQQRERSRLRDVSRNALARRRAREDPEYRERERQRDRLRRREKRKDEEYRRRERERERIRRRKLRESRTLLGDCLNFASHFLLDEGDRHLFSALYASLSHQRLSQYNYLEEAFVKGHNHS